MASAWLSCIVSLQSLVETPRGRKRHGAQVPVDVAARPRQCGAVHVHLIDGTYELFRAYYGVPGRKNAAGREIGASRGLLRSLGALLREPATTHVAVAFDHVVESFRNELFHGYKTGEGIELELREQFELAERVAGALGVQVWPMVEFEADDAMAAAAAALRDDPAVTQIHLCSPDKDLAQCVVGTQVVLHDRRKELLIDEAGVHDKWGVAPESIPDYLALVGDTADGIPGIPRWGAKSTASVLARYVHLEDIPADPADWGVKVRGAARLSQELEAARDDATLYRRLATLRTDVPLGDAQGPLSLDALAWKGVDARALAAVAEEVEDPGIVERMAAAREAP